MSSDVLDELKDRGFIAQVSDEAAVRKMLAEKTVTFYIGYDSTASSLHAGSLVPIMAMVHLRRAGHRAIAVIGGGTTMVGDPSGKTEMRQMLDEATIRSYGESIHAQLDRYLEFDGARRPGRRQRRLAPAAELHRIPPRHRPPFQRQPDARRRSLQAPARKRPVVHRVQLPAPPGLRLPHPLPDATAAPSRWAATTNGATSWPASTSSAGSRGPRSKP